MLAALILLLTLPSLIIVIRTMKNKPKFRKASSVYRPLLEQGVALNEALVKARFEDFYVVEQLVETVTSWEAHVDQMLQKQTQTTAGK